MTALRPSLDAISFHPKGILNPPIVSNPALAQLDKHDSTRLDSSALPLIYLSKAFAA